MVFPFLNFMSFVGQLRELVSLSVLSVSARGERRSDEESRRKAVSRREAEWRKRTASRRGAESVGRARSNHEHYEANGQNLWVC